MSPRRARRRTERVGEGRPLLGRLAEVEEHPDGDWVVRPVTGATATKGYRCPGCDQEIPPGVRHVVAWRPDDAADRRHWHNPCWAARDRRGVKVHRSKNAPHYG